MEQPPYTRPTHVALFERFFRAAAGLDIDKEDLRRYHEFIDHKIRDLLIRGEAAAEANGRDIIRASDLPITKGLQESIHAFHKIEGVEELRQILDRLIPRPPLDLAIGDSADERLAEVGGGLSVALARCFKIIEPELKNPQTAHWERSFQIFDLLL
jgi:hypothetical protein